MVSVCKQRVAVIGATGQVGLPLTINLLLQGHEVTLLARARNRLKNDKLQILLQYGAHLTELSDMSDVTAMANALSGIETLICAVPGSKAIITQSEPLWLEAAIAAGVKRFVPSEFGAHTRAIQMGEGEVFDNKKRLHDKLFNADIGWTLFYNGGIFDYFLPNLRFFPKITTFGDLDIPICTHHIQDIGRLAALAFTDERTLNHCVQVDFNMLSQNRMLEILKSAFPAYPFEYQHYSTDYIIEARASAGNAVSAKKGAETDLERWGINYVVYVLGLLTAFTDETLRASELYPDFRVIQTPEQALHDPRFVFEW
ncbi:hypothetical protein GCM10023116_32340 [Kistimonas scapharcae]|uniref:NmrA-like domain-containing protein n=1 Tax=Kistimonas scapharcae TaxID=1036133 RepID=A0ABP8V4X3_9GAMM